MPPALTVVDGGSRKDMIDVLNEAIERVRAGEVEAVMVGMLLADKPAEFSRAWTDGVPFLIERMHTLSANMAHACLGDELIDF